MPLYQSVCSANTKISADYIGQHNAKLIEETKDCGMRNDGSSTQVLVSTGRLCSTYAGNVAYAAACLELVNLPEEYDLGTAVKRYGSMPYVRAKGVWSHLYCYGLLCKAQARHRSHRRFLPLFSQPLAKQNSRMIVN